MTNNTRTADNQIVSDHATLFRNTFIKLSKDLNERANAIEVNGGDAIEIQAYRDGAVARIADAASFQAWINAGRP